MKIEMKVKNQKALKRIIAAPSQLQEELVKVNMEYAPHILADIKFNASGPPQKPERVTGAYVDSIHITDVSAEKMCFGSQAPQAARLEYGFVGTDSLGREYHQPPYPHFRPAIAFWVRPWSRALARQAARLMRRRYNG